MKLVPLSDRVVLKQCEAEETTKSGIILTSSAQEKPQEAEVIAVGPGGIVDGKEVTMQVKEGQKVKAKVLNTTDNKISLSMKALEEEMVDTEPAEDLEQYTSKESFGSSLGSLLAGIKLD